MSDKVGLLFEAGRLGQERDAARAERDAALRDRDEALRDRDKWEAIALDRAIELLTDRVTLRDVGEALTERAVPSRDEARTLAKSLLALLEGYLRLDVAAPKRIRDEAAAARARIESWEENP